MSIIEKNRRGSIRIHKQSLSRELPNIIFGVLFLGSMLGFYFLDSKGVNFAEGIYKTGQDLLVMFSQPHNKHFSILEGIGQIGITLALAFLTTLIGGVISLFLALAAARNLANERIGMVIKAIVAFIRAIPTVLWVLIFAIGAGLGAVAAVIGMTFHTVGYLLKAYSESYEEIDNGVIEALESTGASWWQIIFQAVFPACITSILSWTFIRFEINFVTAVAMGAAAAAGGIGFDLFMASSFYFDLREVGCITWGILIVAVFLEWIANKLKKSFIVHH